MSRPKRGIYGLAQFQIINYGMIHLEMPRRGKGEKGMINNWSDLYGEWDTQKGDNVPDRTRGIYCHNCDDLILWNEMKPWKKDDDTLDMLCPGCDAVLIEGE